MWTAPFSYAGASSAISIDGFPVATFLILCIKIDEFPNPLLKIDGFLGTHADEAPDV